jgi:hypothetical protein
LARKADQGQPDGQANDDGDEFLGHKDSSDSG